MLGHGGIVHTGLVGVPVSSVTTTVLAAATGTFTLTGEAATFQVKEPASFGSFALTGEAATFQIGEAIASGSYALTGESATFQPGMAEGFGSYALTGETATAEIFLPVGPGIYVLTGESLVPYSIVDTLLHLQMPINAILHGQQYYKTEIEFDDIGQARVTHRTTLSASKAGRLAGDAPSFTAKTGNKGYD